ncbi:hypothetical protein ACFLVO_00185 [Chloroflexota bacterium]
MVKARQAIQLVNNSLQHSVDQLCCLQPDIQALVTFLISRLVKTEGVSINIDYKLPAEGLDLWKMGNYYALTVNVKKERLLYLFN